MEEGKNILFRSLQEADTVLDTSVNDSDAATESIPADLDRLRTGQYSDVGKRRNQQDAAFVSETYSYIVTGRALAVLCDGMGGLAAGERASSYCVEQMVKQFDRIFRPDAAEDEKDIPRFFALMLDEMDGQVKKMKNEQGDPLGAGTTFVGAILDGRDLYWASVGDSHMYIISDTDMILVTTEHNVKTVLERQVALGHISAEEAKKHPKQEALVSFLGMGGLRLTDITEKPYRMCGGDRVLLCSDGLYRSLTEGEITEIVREAGDDMETAARTLVETAVRKGNPHQDNTTAVLMKYLG